MNIGGLTAGAVGSFFFATYFFNGTYIYSVIWLYGQYLGEKIDKKMIEC